MYCERSDLPQEIRGSSCIPVLLMKILTSLEYLTLPIQYMRCTPMVRRTPSILPHSTATSQTCALACLILTTLFLSSAATGQTPPPYLASGAAHNLTFASLRQLVKTVTALSSSVQKTHRSSTCNQSRFRHGSDLPCIRYQYVLSSSAVAWSLRAQVQRGRTSPVSRRTRRSSCPLYSARAQGTPRCAPRCKATRF